jgi:hypothetical protein
MLIATALAALAIPASQAGAATWSEIPSGTASDITALEYQSDSRFWFTTASGGIFTRQPNGSFAQTLPNIGVPFNDIEFQQGGQIGLAVGKNGKVYRSTNAGASWTEITGIPVSKKSTTFVDCSGSEPLGDVYSVRFAGNNRVWIFAAGSQIARSQPVNVAQVGDTGTWVDANRAGDDTCKLHASYAVGYTDGFFVPSNPDVGYILGTYFGQVWLTTNNLATEATEQTADAGNGFKPLRHLTGDPANPSRMWSVSPDPDNISTTTYTTDGYATSNRWNVVNDSVRTFNAPADVDFSGGTVLGAGTAGEILNSIDGQNFFHVTAGGALATAAWKAVGLASATKGAVGGAGGKLALTSDANAIPDIVAPTGTISGPTQLNAGQSGTYTLNAADTGGSGLNAGSFAWTAEGLPGQTGNPVTFTFPNSGFYTIRVHFTDNAGNPADAQISVSVGSGPTITPVLSLKGPGNTATAVIVGDRIKVRMKGSITMPPGVDKNAACTGQIRLKLKKGKRTMLNRTTPVKLKKGKCRFAKTVYLKRSKVGRTRRLKLKIRFLGNQVLKAGSVSKTLTIRK